ncbi:hypothetical protein BG011_006701 [Mortierella polycephala]|uniref:RNI-like protein n=1 Tax=Mortierella polycephala TaxID=41804 RepID=A0A9P6PVC0_9FUNG|nr:hypothetical protein BG011_006701 [Mortierella polycephala]
MPPHPLDLPEIILRVGEFIPLWIRDYTSARSGRRFTPKDLVAAIRVNRTFHSTLTPLLWAIYNESEHLAPSYSIDYHFPLQNQDSLRKYPSIQTILKNSIHFRSYENTICTIESLEYRCTQLRVLKLSRWAASALAANLIITNSHTLRYLSWESHAFNSMGDWGVMSSQGYAALNSLTKLEILELRLWTVEHHRLTPILARLSPYLKTLVLADMRGLNSEQDWTLLPTLTHLTLNSEWWANTAIQDLVRFCPALETLILDPNAECDARAIGRHLRECCPNLSAIECTGPKIFQSSMLLDDDEYAALIHGCAPVNTANGRGGLKRFDMVLDLLDDDTTNALLAHAGSLESLELYIVDDMPITFKNLNLILSRCTKLKLVFITNYLLEWPSEIGMEMFREPWGCKELESLSLEEFGSAPYMSAEETSDVIEEEAGDEGDNVPEGWIEHKSSVRGKKHLRSPPGQALKRKLLKAANELPNLTRLSLNCTTYRRTT